ncbi:MAG TPA: 16S rRNA (cytosine(967)-C(5))-methyltransferase RsmB [Pyrinomonadaceae bacterium]|nr:16S rRNA (cytosine(967)-C(5))-methyltransferase RsmB [Pyrinomonadaceae bacterium]
MAKSSFVSPARLAAFEILMRVEEGAYASVLLNARASELGPLDRALCHELVMGVLRWQLWLDRLAAIYSRREPSELDSAVRVILRLGLYQLRFLNRVPDSAAVNESVNLVKHARLRSASGLVNAVLRRATRETEVDPAHNIDDPIERLAVETSHPLWLIDRWCKSFGLDEAGQFARANNEAAPVAFRVVKTRAEGSAILDQLRQAGGLIEPSQIARDAWRIRGATQSLASLAAQGCVYIQDEASQLVAEALNAQPGDKVLDLCAAPGSKTTQIADASGATVIGSDVHEHRLRALKTSVNLQGLTNVSLLTLNGLNPLPFLDETFDCVLVDAPCSGTGTLRRNPEIRWRISPGDIESLSQRQGVLLQNASRAVKPGGRLVYSTCSVEIEENEAIRQSFLKANSSFSSTDLGIQSAVASAGDVARTWPHKVGTDGFFLASFKRDD